MSFPDQVFRCHSRRICIVDQHSVKCHIMVPIIQHQKWTCNIFEQCHVFFHQLRSQKDDRGGVIMDQPIYLLFIIFIPMIQIAQHHLHPRFPTSFLNSIDYQRKKWRILHDHTAMLEHNDLDLSDPVFVNISHFLRHAEYL